MPEIASRAHLTAIVPVVEQRACATPASERIDAVAVTNAPGLVGALLVGVSYAKAFAFARGIPVIGVHHMEGHLFATALEHPDAVPPFTALLVSGGHTLLLDVEAWGQLPAARPNARRRGRRSVRQSCQAARASVSWRPARRATRRGERRAAIAAIRAADAATRPAARRRRLLRCVIQRSQDRRAQRRESRRPSRTRRGAIARAFQDALIDTLVEKTARAARQFGRGRVVLGGGVACNHDARRARCGNDSRRGGSRCSRRRRASRPTTRR